MPTPPFHEPMWIGPNAGWPLLRLLRPPGRANRVRRRQGRGLPYPHPNQRQGEGNNGKGEVKDKGEVWRRVGEGQKARANTARAAGTRAFEPNSLIGT